MLANCLRAGLGLQQAIEFVSINGPVHIAEEFKVIIGNVKVGKTIDDALIEWKESTPVEDVWIVVESILILRQTGGNLAETFTVIAKTIRERQRVEGRIKVLTTQGIMQAVIITILPFVIAAALALISDWYIRPLFTTGFGWFLIMLMLFLQMLGAIWMRKIVRVNWIIILLLPAVVSANGTAEYHVRCYPNNGVSYISAAVLKMRGVDATTVLSEGRKRIISHGGTLSTIESGIVTTRVNSRETIKKADRRYFLSDDCGHTGVVTLDDIAMFGLPSIYPFGPLKEGSTWRRLITILYNGIEVPIAVSCTPDRVTKMLEKDVVATKCIISGFDSVNHGTNLRWMGIGEETWDISRAVPIVRTLEMRRGRTFTGDVDIELSYAEAVVD